MRERRVQRVHYPTKPRLAVDGDGRRGFRHVLAQLAIQVGHFGGRVPALGGAVGEGGSELGVTLATPFVWEDRLLMALAC